MFEFYQLKIHPQALATASAVFAACVSQYYFNQQYSIWLVFSAYLVCQASRGAALKQALNYGFVMILLAIIAPPFLMSEIEMRVISVMVGCVIGAAFTRLIFIEKPYDDFSRDIIPVLVALRLDLTALREQFAADQFNAAQQRHAVSNLEKVLTLKNSHYPEWVFDVGFNPGLRAGFRFFLVQIDRLAEMTFALNDVIRQTFTTALKADMQSEVLQVMNGNIQLLSMLIDFFNQQSWQLTTANADYTQDMQALEKTLNNHVPTQLELLDVAPDYLIVTNMVKLVKDVRETLLQLLTALPKH